MLIPRRLSAILLFAFSLGALSVALQNSAHAKDYFLTIGGGYSPLGNQISIERNILFFKRLLAEQNPDGVDQATFFADGDSPGRDLQYDNSENVPRVNQLLASVLGSGRYLGLAYRSNQVPDVDGKTSRENIDRWFDEVGSQLKSGDRLMLYVTAHGGNSKNRKKPNNTTIYLWNHKTIDVSELTKRLDKLPEGVSVVTIMVQCHSGGFAHLIFDQGDATKKVSPRDRCGFFATIHSRQAAGCTADINEENYQEYSTFFWAALGGKNRMGDRVAAPDYNDDGAVSFEEAHAYTMITSDTIDVPIKTSGEMLRAALAAEIKKKKKPENWLWSHADYEKLLAHASPSETAVLEGLSKQLNLDKSERTKQAREAAKKIERERAKLSKTNRDLSTKRRGLRNKIGNALKVRWPEFANPFHPDVAKILSDHPHELVTVIESHKDWPKLEKSIQESNRIDAKRLDLEREWAKHQRFIRTAENVSLAVNLARFTKPETQQRYARILAYEKGGLKRTTRDLPETEEAVAEESVSGN